MNPRPPTFAQSTWLVAEREITVRLRSKAFLISTGILFALILGAIIFGGFTSKSTPEATAVAVTSQTEHLVAGNKDFRATIVGDVAEARTLVTDGKVEAALVPDSSNTNPLGFEILAKSEAPTEIMGALSISPPVDILDPGSTNSLLLYLVALAFGVVFMSSAVTFGSVIAQSVVEEKQTRVVEILMSALPVRTLLAGKVIGNSILAFAQIAVIAVLAVIGLNITGQEQLLDTITTPMIWFVIFFVVGFVLLATMYAAAASMVSRLEDVGSMTTPITMLVMIPYVLSITSNSNPEIMAIMSYVPFSAAVGMPIRIFAGEAAWWEPLLSLGILLASTYVILIIGSRIYRGSLLRTGGRVKFSEALADGK
ncbi:ABC transporter permease [Lysinibacter sp. HNR]|uniref:ABC transporter permease n=1 Tax=Lysinibacter sp. HNR TaxID=3031408 RepID=UPI002434D0B6|nr:ABC transporter permease [Lysinibacter sp. HNR]WGD37509.1 ABC transporter permease [Lysinibacter sp. HNR]